MLSLMELKNYIQHKKEITLTELSIHFKEDASLLDQMLQHLVNKKLIATRQLTTACQTTCNNCDQFCTKIFTWNTGVKLT